MRRVGNPGQGRMESLDKEGLRHWMRRNGDLAQGGMGSLDHESAPVPRRWAHRRESQPQPQFGCRCPSSSPALLSLTSPTTPLPLWDSSRDCLRLGKASPAAAASRPGRSRYFWELRLCDARGSKRHQLRCGFPAPGPWGHSGPSPRVVLVPRHWC